MLCVFGAGRHELDPVHAASRMHPCSSYGGLCNVRFGIAVVVVMNVSACTHSNPAVYSTGSVTQVNYVGENMQATTLPNQLEQLHSKLLAHLVPFAEAFCNVLAASANPPPKRPPESAIVGGPCKYSSCEVKELLTEFRVTAITVLTQLATVYPQALDSFPLAFWRAVVNWFLEHKTSTMFLVATSKLFVQVIQSQRTETLKLLFTKLKFLSRIVTFYTTEAPSGSSLCLQRIATFQAVPRVY